MPRLATLISVFVLALPGAAFAQGAGDDQYQDPFGDEPAQNDGGSGGGDDGLSDEPTVPGDGGGSGGGSGSSGSGSSGSGSSGSGSAGSTAPATGTTASPSTASATPAASGEQLPNTGSDPRFLFLLGAAFVLTGAGLRLRTIDPDAF
ncbi:MAG TPA: LPXTG cell wall anchor domain-containing protein [Solirubrobacteraceae bacterium]|nr:LPXTG cell wall anchor domain-containing protein [Solirubrobacteraceae bacterium]